MISPGRWTRAFLRVLPLALVVAASDWAMKMYAVSSGGPVLSHWFNERPNAWFVVAVTVVAVGLVVVNVRTPVEAAGAALVLGAALGNLGELAVFGRVTDFIPFPPGSLSAPADHLLMIGWFVFAWSLIRRVHAAASSAAKTERA